MGLDQQLAVGAKRGALVLGVGRIRLGQHPLRGPLKERVLANLASEGTGELHCGGAGADHADATLGEVDRVVPSSAVEPRAGERLCTRQVGNVGMVEHAGRCDHHVEDVAVPGRGLEHPATVDELAGEYLVTETNAFHHAVVGRHLLEVGLDLRTRGERVGPFRVRREGVRIEVRGHVTCDAGIGVLAPGPTEGVRLLEDGDVGVSGLAQLDDAENPGHARTDHRESQRSSFSPVAHTHCSPIGLAGTLAVRKNALMATTFTRMDESTAEQWAVIGAETMANQPRVANEVLSMLRRLEGITDGFAINQLVHSLQTATRAERAGADQEMIVASLCHDMGKVVSVFGHPEIAASILRPYVRDDVYQVIRVHQDFQGRHYYHHFGRDVNARDQHAGEPWYELAERFADEWDQVAFDPDGEYESLGHFEPMVREVFAEPAPLSVSTGDPRRP